ncbi:hypothetical protein AsAng_0009080 [Aureispira anguillae]|uniref:Uncharacterized protein n=1 Tax=Aureispira anguillae TaxID=2864201 RepID=A0A915YBU0_9BACT|nr:hypothetical protein AsAng_0009080 [Aureispira anguillae]
MLINGNEKKDKNRGWKETKTKKTFGNLTKGF